MPGIALQTANAADRIALRGVRLHAVLAGMSQRTTIEQTFVNLENQAIEAVYTFPLPENAAVCHFEVVTGDHVLTGQIDEADQAAEKYEQAVAEGHGAFMMEEDRPDVFTIRAGNLKPHQAATIRLTYVAPLEYADGQIRLAFPTTVAPRYVTETGCGDPLASVADGDAVNPPHVLHVPYGLTMRVDVALGRPINSITSPSHLIYSQTGEDNQQTVTLAADVTEMNRDIVLQLQLKRDLQPFVQVEKGSDGASYLAVTFIPEFPADDLAPPPACETVFILDCSGSMQGESIAQATAALSLCLRSLNPGDTFNICRFGSNYELMASEPLVYSQEALTAALNYVTRGADLGGTELYPPLEATLAQAPQAGGVRQVILLTDGQVSNESAVIALARKHRAHNRIFSFGIGSACSASLVKGLARATGGASEFITAGERIDDKVLRTFSRIASPGLTDVRMDWGGAEAQTLAELPPVFDGDALAVFARIAGSLPREVALTCNGPAGATRWAVAVPHRLRDGGGVVATMWARRAIQSLEEVNDLTRMSPRQRRESKDAQALIDLSKRFGLICSLTTFIAVEHRSLADRTDGRPAERRVPVMLAKGWGGVEEYHCIFASAPPPMAAGALPQASCIADTEPTMERGRNFSDVDSLRDFTRESEDTSLGAVYEELSPPAASAPPPRRERHTVRNFLSRLTGSVPRPEASLMTRSRAQAPPPVGVPAILALQGAEGWFAADALLADLLKQHGRDERKCREAIEAAAKQAGYGKPAGELARVVSTVLALHLLRTSFAADSALWRRAEAKALRYLAQELSMSRADVEVWLAQVSKEILAT